MQAAVDREKLFWAGCLAFLRKSLFFRTPATIANQVGTDFALNESQPATIANTACCAFALAVIIGRMIGDGGGRKSALVTPKNKTTKLNHFQLWFPGEMVIESLSVYLHSKTRIESIGLIPIILIVALTELVL